MLGIDLSNEMLATPQAQIKQSEPKHPTPIPVKSRALDYMQVDSTPLKPYNLRKNSEANKFRRNPEKKKRERADSWDDPHFVQNMKIFRHAGVSEEAMEIVESLEDKNLGPGDSNGRSRGKGRGRGKGRAAPSRIKGKSKA
ncbi:hypothetical protein BT96DRAFT_947066 [Gymnopus androsaceus JB14]|uniref:Uncharacterized protein n=1 Tax=Gymnopus androsaceus JB14 TaxID=1447944 RepID=A0A6A4GUZ6_9AGAR|nr:hypothetical protein BT96DRAFT_947066 [Gymnopus androsaceus JB14]